MAGVVNINTLTAMAAQCSTNSLCMAKITINYDPANPGAIAPCTNPAQGCMVLVTPGGTQASMKGYGGTNLLPQTANASATVDILPTP